MLLRRYPVEFNYIVNLNPYALARVLFGKSLIPWWRALDRNKRNSKAINDSEFQDVILSGINPNCYTAWVYFYNRGRDMISQMQYQIDAFVNKATFPVYIIQGRDDKGQVSVLTLLCVEYKIIYIA